MEAIIDGIIFQLQTFGGISRLYRELLPRMCDLDDSLAITLLTSGRHNPWLPYHSRISHVSLLPIGRVPRPGRLWKPVLQMATDKMVQCAVGGLPGRIWHSTYYTSNKNWNGPVVVTVVDMIYEKFLEQYDRSADDAFRLQKLRAISSADIIICISETTERDVQSYYGIRAEKTCVIPLAQSEIFQQLPKYVSKQGTNGGKPFLLYVGKREGYKNFETVLDAYYRWSGKNDVALVVVGQNWSKNEAKSLNDYGLKKHIHLLTGVDDSKLCELYNFASALVFPSRYEGFGIPLLEAMVCGCPIIASRIPSTLEVAGEWPVYFEPNEPDQLRAAFDVALSEGRQSERVKQGIKRAGKFSWEKTAKQTLEVYYDVLRK